MPVFSGKSKMTEINVGLVEKLIRAQFPQWAELPIAPVENGGWDNRTFRLGDSVSIRLPSALCYVAQVEKEHRWLPVLGRHLPLRSRSPLALGLPALLSSGPTAEVSFPHSLATSAGDKWYVTALTNRSE
jgi:aminoglycoside phosphotransferase (APT) family kinase protein